MKKYPTFLLLAVTASVASPAFAQSDLSIFKTPANFRGVAFLREIRRGDSTPLAKARAIYPEFRVQTPVARFANWQLRGQARQAVLDAAESQGKQLSEFKPILGMALVYDQTPRLHFLRPQRLISTSFSFYTFSGGAHGMFATITQNYGQLPGEARPRELKLGDFFVPGSGYRKRIDQKLLAKLRANTQQEATWVKTGELKTLGANLGNFIVEADGLRWFFAPYEVGPYAAGEFEVKLSMAELGLGFRRELLQAR